MATATKILQMLLLLSCTIPSARNQSNKDMDIDITSLMDATLFCTFLKGVPKNFVSEDSWLQIRHADTVNPKPKPVASLLWNGDIEVKEEFQKLAPSTTAKGNISEGWLEATIENIPPAAYGNYSCVVIDPSTGGDTKYLEYKLRVIYIDQMSSGVLSSEPAGFEGTIRQKLQVSCIKGSNLCNKTFPVTLTSDNKNDSILQEGIMPTWECGSGKETTCYLRDVWMNRTEKFNCIAGNNASVSPNTRKCNTRDLTTGTNKQNQKNKSNTIILGVFGGVVLYIISLFVSYKYLPPIFLHVLIAPMPYVFVQTFYTVRHKYLTGKLLTDAHPTATGQDKTNPGSKSLDEAEASASNTETLDLEEIVTEGSRSVGSKIIIDPPEDTAAEIEELTANITEAVDAVKPKQAKGMKPEELRALLVAYQNGSENSSSV